MIVLVTGSSRAEECAAAIERKTQQKTAVVRSLTRVVECLQQFEVEALVIDESFQQVESGIDNVVATHSSTAVPIYVNLSLHGAERVALEVSCGLQRLAHERLLSMRATAAEFRSQLRGEVTAILLNAEMAMRETPSATGAADRLRALHEMAERMRQKLEGTPPNSAKMPLRPRLVDKPRDVSVTK